MLLKTYFYVPEIQENQTEDMSYCASAQTSFVVDWCYDELELLEGGIGCTRGLFIVNITIVKRNEKKNVPASRAPFLFVG